MMRRALLLLTPDRAAVFSRSAATEGEHKTLLGPPGGALLGWAAADGRYDAFGPVACAIFHSGRVRFSDAVPLTPAGEPVWPAPQILTKPKIGPKPFKGDKIDESVVQVGRKSGDTEQRDALKCLVSPSLSTVSPEVGGRLRTALDQGVAATGKLFGFAHVEASAETCYAASIEAEAGALSNEDDWRKLLAAFDRRLLRLGRGAGTAYGGGYYSEVRDGAGGDLWPPGTVSKGAKTVRVWALSDCALLDERGAPTFRPSAAAIGLPPGGVLDSRESAVTTRRYAPWNRKLNCRDVDRQVIEAGSVLTFTYPDGVPENREGPGAIGLWREAGLGRIWVAPPMLAPRFGEPTIAGLSPTYALKAERRAPVMHDAMRAPAATLASWLSAAMQRQGAGRG